MFSGTSGVLPGMEWGFVLCGDGHAAAESERAAGDFEAWGGLSSFVLASVDHANDAEDGCLIETLLHDLCGSQVLLDISVEDGVEEFIRREGVLVGLVWLQFGGWRLGDAVAGNQFTPGGVVDVLGEAVDVGFGDIADDGESAAHVAIEGAVAGGELAFVAGGEEEVSVAIGECHEQSAADPGLEILFGEVIPEEGIAEPVGIQQIGEGVFIGGMDGVDGEEVELDVEVFGEGFGIGDGVIGAVAAGHGDADDAVVAQGRDGECAGYGGIDATGESEDGAGEAAFSDIVAESEDEGMVDRLDAG